MCLRNSSGLSGTPPRSTLEQAVSDKAKSEELNSEETYEVGDMAVGREASSEVDVVKVQGE